ncbi:MAG: response regulator, partial [Coleofasciculus sp. C3-bin4]|nr:response regulator [Coleofasciculus sp. C3-bin4]
MLSLDLPQSPSSPELAQAMRILVVEDEDLIREMLVLALEEEGYEVVTAVDGRTALALLQYSDQNHGEFPFSLLILDLMLPQVNGLDLCRLLRYQGNPVPILIL